LKEVEVKSGREARQSSLSRRGARPSKEGGAMRRNSGLHRFVATAIEGNTEKQKKRSSPFRGWGLKGKKVKLQEIAEKYLF